MLSDNNTRKINRQIESELRTVDSFMSSDEEKAAAIERISALKDLLTETPSRKSLLKELALAIIEARQEVRDRNEPETYIEALFGIRR